MDVIVIFICMCCLCCCSLLMSTGGLFFKASQNLNVWKCTDIGSKKYVVSRINGTFDAECMYDPKNVGCFIIKPDTLDNKVDKVDLKDQCENLIKNFPKVTLKNDSVVNLEVYTCGNNSTNSKLWNTTGYDNPKDTCYKILSDRSLLKETESIVNTLLHQVKVIS